MAYLFNDFELEVETRELRKNGAPISVEPKAFDVLAFLIEQRHRMVTKDEIVEAVWQGRFISDNALSSAVRAARSSVGDDGRSQNVIRTVHGHGFRFVTEVETSGSSHADRDQPLSKPDLVSPTNLKRRRRDLIGRDFEKAALSERLRGFGIASIVGPGGAGKTALATDIALDLMEEFPGGVWFCELAPVQQDQVGSAVIGAIDSSAGVGQVRAEMIADRLGDAPTLLVMDNCEHVIEPAAALVGELVDLLPKLAVLTTSREALEIQDEKVFRLGGLNHTTTNSVASEMFFRCAGQVTDLPRNSETDETVRRIVERLDGLPLAIELAAPQLASRTTEELLHELNDQLSILATRRRHGIERHGTMDDAIAWSYDLLDPMHQEALASLSVFSGAFTVQAAEAVCAMSQTRGILHDLVGKSMVTFAPGNPVSRFRLLEPIRQFARRQLDKAELEVLRERHAKWFAERGIQFGREMRGADEIEACEALTVEWSDFRRALAWGRENRDPDIAVEPLLALQIHLLWQFRLEAFDWLEAGVEACELDDPMQARAEVVGSMGPWSAGDLDRAEAMIAASENLGGERIGTRYLAFYVRFVREDFSAAVKCSARAWELAQASDDPIWRIMTAAFHICGLAMNYGVHADIAPLLKTVEKELALNPWPSGRCCVLLAKVVSSFGRGAAGDVEKYRREMEVAADVCHAPWFKVAAAGMENPNSKRSEAEAMSDLSMYTKNVASAMASGDAILIPTILKLVAICLVDLGKFELAAKLCGLIPKLRGLGEKGSMSPGFDDAVLATRKALTEDQFDAFASVGRGWELADAVDALEAVVES